MFGFNEAVLPFHCHNVDRAPESVPAELILNTFSRKTRILPILDVYNVQDDGFVWREEEGLCATKKTYCCAV